MALRSKDLFDDSSMSFGDHLEELRYYLIRALLGVILVSIFTLIFGNKLVALVRSPIDRALIRHGLGEHRIDDLGDDSFIERFVSWTTSLTEGKKKTEEELEEEATGIPRANARLNGPQIDVQIPQADLLNALHKADPGKFPTPVGTSSTDPKAKPAEITLRIRAPEFSIFREVVKKTNRPVTLNVQEAFLTYVKVALVSGVVLSSPWIFFNAWMFVASGLYPHERKFVYLYGSLSLVLFLIGAVFCFYVVFPFILEFLLSFNAWLDVQPQIRLSEWVSFAVFLPLMFGISFQLPLVMVFLNRLNIFTETVYREQRRMAILVIAGLSMILTPSDPASMLLMMFPLIFLYEFGIYLCKLNPAANPFEREGELST
ncbi:twin-arginine translocase subunit TatC [Rubinisphaera italica]|uniref:Sec-independent protein translocase protein TatC n=1 Tax=Rubinisphaera italica TaxID=2527969 RepID=A0A5C5XI76_9PLAN|nr:twin-arginine translocase subunit TatC [Rubinisphaera italica]TWT62504.1 Sec-independent protein translocase protein TatCy [Rubinisphaera italica]